MVDSSDSTTDHGGAFLVPSETGIAKSFASRLASSTTCLARNVVGRSKALEFSASLAFGSGLGSKASNASSSNSPSNSIEDLPTRSCILTLPESSRGSLRSTSRQKVREDEFAAFMSSFTPISAGVESSVSAFPATSILADDTAMVDSDWKLSTYLQEPSQSTFDWNTVLRSRTKKLGAPESFNAAQLHDVKEEDIQNILASPVRSDNHALFRLRLIVGHIANTVHSTSSTYQQHSVLQSPHGQGPYLATGAAFRQSHLHQTSSASTSATTYAFHHENLIASGQRNIHKCRHRPNGQNSPRTVQYANQERTAPTVHCSWTVCHKRFNNASQFRKYTAGHSPFGCPHEHCNAQYQSLSEWADHISMPHH